MDTKSRVKPQQQSLHLHSYTTLQKDFNSINNDNKLFVPNKRQ